MNRLKKHIKNKYTLIGVIILLLLILPMLLDILNWGQFIPFYKNTSSDGWLSFLGALSGFAVIYITIKHEKKQFNEDKRISVKPYLNIILEGTKSTERYSNIGVISINYNNMNINLYENKVINLVITNLGLGHCLRCEVIEIKLNGIKLNEDASYIGNIGVNESRKGELMIVFWFGDILENLKSKYIDKQLGSPEKCKEKINKSSLNTVELIMKYKDILGNEYKKNIVLNVNADFKLEFDEQFRIKNISYNYLNIEHDEKKDSEICL